MGEAGPLTRSEPLPPPGPTQERVVRDAAQDEHDPDPGQEPQLRLEIGTTAGQLDWERTVAGWRAAGGGGDPAILQLQAVIAMGGGGLGREPELVQRRVQPVAARITGEHAAGAVGPVRRGGQADDQQSGGRVAPPGNGFPPIDLARERAFPNPGDLAAVRPQPGATLAADDATGQRLERRPAYRVADQVPVKLYVMVASPMLQATCPLTWSSFPS